MKRIFVIFGGTGDLTKKKLLPAFKELKKKKESFKILALGRRYTTTEEYMKAMLHGKESSRFKKSISYAHYDMKQNESYKLILEPLRSLIKNSKEVEIVFYLALMPELYEKAIQDITQINQELTIEVTKKVVVEKPFGFDFASAKQYNNILRKAFSDDEIYRIDHYLGKEFVQNLLIMRFNNDIMQTLWNKDSIDHVQIIIDENKSVGNRLEFYEHVEIIRDMVQNHILQILTHLTIAEPVSFGQKEISFEKMKILRSIRPIEDFAIGQYKTLSKEANKKTNTKTAIGLKMFVDTFEFSGVPIYVRTGKMLPKNRSVIYMEFKNYSCKSERCQHLQANALIIEIQPNMSINIRLNMKMPKVSWGVNEVKFNFDHYKTFKINTPEAYEQMIEKIIHNDKTLFPCEGEILESWKIIDPLIEKAKTAPLEIYDDHSIPKNIKNLIEKDGKTWFEE